jgi:hypothetical protein
VLPVDADDNLYPDALQVVSHYVYSRGFPALLYTDEDKVIGSRSFQPYLKPDWDPVLALNSAYIAHLGIIDREKALELGAYSDPRTEGSPDWDVFIRFMIAGYTPVHIAEVLYSWRAHARSTADDAAYKPYVHSSQKAVLQRFLDARPDATNFTVENSPLLEGAAHWYFSRKHGDPRPFASIVLTKSERSSADRPGPVGDYPMVMNVALSITSEVAALEKPTREMAHADGFLVFMDDAMEIDRATGSAQWAWDALGLFELHSDIVMVGSRIRNRKGIITDAGRYFGYGGACGCPNRGRSVLDPGYFTQMWKQRSVSAVSTQFAVVKASFLLDLLESLPSGASVPFLGAWAGAQAARTGKRVVYSPFLSAVSDLDWESLVGRDEEKLFAEVNKDLIPDRRFYSRHLSLGTPFALD